MLNKLLKLNFLLVTLSLITSCGKTHLFKGYEGDQLARKELSIVAVKNICTDINNKPCVPSSCKNDADVFFTKFFNEKTEKETVIWQPKSGLSHKYKYLIIKPGNYALGVQMYLNSKLVGKDIIGKINNTAVSKSTIRNTYGFAYLNVHAEADSVYQLDCGQDNTAPFQKLPMRFSDLEWMESGFDKAYVRE